MSTSATSESFRHTVKTSVCSGGGSGRGWRSGRGGGASVTGGATERLLVAGGTVREKKVAEGDKRQWINAAVRHCIYTTETVEESQTDGGGDWR